MKSIIRKSYDREADRYDVRFKELQYAKYAALLDLVLIGPAVSILDLGCGTGLLKQYLAERGRADTTISGVDFSFPMLQQARDRGVMTVQADIDSLPFCDRSFDRVLAVTVIRIIPGYETEIFAEMHRVLKPGGIWGVSILRNRFDASFVDHLCAAGLTMLGQMECGQDIGFYGCR